MANEPQGDQTSASDGSTGLIFVSDASAEAERLTVALRARGYPVVDVPLGLLMSRVSVQRPALILLDADARGAIEVARDLKASQRGDSIKLVFVREPDRGGAEGETMKELASATFSRPVEVYALLRKAEALIGPPSEAVKEGRLRATHRPTLLMASARKPYRYEGRDGPRRAEPEAPPRDGPGSEPASEVEPSRPRPSSNPVVGGAVPDAYRVLGALRQAELSPELSRLLSDAEAHVPRGHAPQPPRRLSPDQEVEVVLPAEILAALDEPLDVDDDDDADSNPGSDVTGGTDRGRGTKTRGTTNQGTAGNHGGETSGGTGAAKAGEESSPGPEPNEEARAGTDPPSTPRPPRAPVTAADGPEPLRVTVAPGSREAGAAEATRPRYSDAPTRDDGARTGAGLPSELPMAARPPSDAPQTARPMPPAERSEARAAKAGGEGPIALPQSLGSGDAARSLARSVCSRVTGALAFEDDAGIRRVVFREGDFITAASSAEAESLVSFLVQRGDLPSTIQGSLGRRVAPFGRHAGAALVAHGYLAQDDLWQVLRAHAEWVLGRVVAMDAGAVSWESEVSGRLREEPAVFGGATGAEVFVEVMRRNVDGATALARLGGERTRLDEGRAASLLDECALDAEQQRRVEQASGRRLSELSGPGAPPEFLAVLYALVELGVLAVVTDLAPARSAEAAAPRVDALDDEAIRARIETRKALVDEGDYFALLGVDHDATSYDIQRAYTELKQQLSPDKVLTARTVDLRHELDVIHEVLDEAFTILRDDTRRDRYRRALESPPRA